ncbi:galactose-specific lectin nattectin [Cherax quadricarinatus]|nr:galactose-specific lectin nattectin-like [Cherax quadricarinatus]
MKWAAALTFVLVTFTVTPGQASLCPEGYQEFTVDSAPVKIKFYMYGKESKGSWSTIRSKCRDEGADLAELRGDLVRQVRNYIFDHPECGYEDEGFWIGGSDAMEEGKWVWNSDNSPIGDDAPWWPGQPDGGTNANYACVYTPDFYLHSCDNDIMIYGLCQI